MPTSSGKVNANGDPIYDLPLPVASTHPTSGLHTAIESGTTTAPNVGGVYEAKVWVWADDLDVSTGSYIKGWRTKKSVPISGVASFFPDSWTKQRTIEEIAYARANLTTSDWINKPTGSNEWKGYSLDGNVKIHMYIGTDIYLSPTSIPLLSEKYGSAFPKK